MNTYPGSCGSITAMAKELLREERALMRLDGWFLTKESMMRHEAEAEGLAPMERAAVLLKAAVRELPLSISDSAIFAGT